jgi:hypothetical protein
VELAIEENTMQYLLLIYDNEKEFEGFPEATQGKIIGEYMAFGQWLQSSGHSIGNNRLQPIDTATTVRVRNGKVATTDGPFAETREQLGGYYLVEAKDLDEAVQIAARIPSAQFGSIEVRPIWVMPG